MAPKVLKILKKPDSFMAPKVMKILKKPAAGAVGKEAPKLRAKVATLVSLTQREVVSKIVTTLKSRADPVRAEGMAKYLKYKVGCYGLSSPDQDRVAKETFSDPNVKAFLLSDETRAWRLCCELLRLPHIEEKQVGISLLGAAVKKGKPSASVAARELKSLEPSFDAGVNNWAVCDNFCSKVFNPLLEANRSEDCNPILQVLQRWNRSGKVWRARASCVALVLSARRGFYPLLAFSHVEHLLSGPLREERFIQLACGWLIREIASSNPTARREANDFLVQHLLEFSREGLRYAVEKLPDADQKRFLLQQKERKKGLK